MSVTLGEWYEYWLDTYMKDTVKQSTYASYRSYLNKHFCVLGKILLKKLEPHTLQEFYNYKFREEGLSPKTLRNYHMALHKCLQQAVKEHLLVYNPCDAVTLPSGEKPEIVVFTNDQQRALVQASYRHRYGVFIRLDLCTGLRMGELLALKWEDIDFSTAQLHVRRTINRLASAPPYMLRIGVCSGLIKDNYRCIFQYRSCNGYTLTLTARKLSAKNAYLRIITVRKF